MSDSVTSFLPSSTPRPSDTIPSITTTPALAHAIATEPSSLNNVDGKEIEQGPPIAAIAGAGAAAVILIVAVAVWYIIRRRRQQQQHQQQQQQQSKSNAVSPSSSSSSKPRAQHSNNNNFDLEKQLDIPTPPSHTDNPSILPTIPNDTINNQQQQQLSSPVLYSSTYNNTSQEDNPSARAKKKASQQSMRQQNRRSPSIQSQASAPTNASGAIVIDMDASTPPVPPRRESMHYQPDAALELQKQLGTASTENDPLSVQMPVVPPSTPASTPASPPSQDAHIDMISLDLDKLMPIFITEELQLPGEERPVTMPTTSPTKNTVSPLAPPQPAMPVPRAQPVHFATEAIPAPVLRRPSMISRKSTDSVRSRVGSACHPPPPPPPSIPLPALPMTCPGGMDARGRRSTTSSHRGSTPSRRSISLESATRWTREGGSDSNNTSARSSQDGFSRGSAPSSPPSSIASSSPASQQHARMPSRSRHQRCPSQILGTQFLASPEGATSPPQQNRTPISPPLAPLTVQIPRTSSRPIHTYFAQQQQQPAFTAPAQPESPTIGSFETSPIVSPTTSIAESLPSIASRTSSRPSHLAPAGGPYLTPSQRSRSRSISQPSSETQRIALPGATGTSLPPVPSLPSLGDHLPPPPPSHSFLLRRYPSLLQHRPSSESLHSMDDDVDPTRRRNRRSLSVDSAGRWISSQNSGSSCSVSPVPGSQGQNDHAEDSDPLARQDQEVQAIIADAIAIAQAKSAAVQAARQSTWYRQYQQQQMQVMQMQMQQQQQQQQQQKTVVASGQRGTTSVNTSPWTPSESHFTEEKTTVSACTSRSNSPFYSSLD